MGLQRQVGSVIVIESKYTYKTVELRNLDVWFRPPIGATRRRIVPRHSLRPTSRANNLREPAV